jgi:hypothetical protein
MQAETSQPPEAAVRRLIVLPHERIEVFSQPHADGYASSRVARRGERLSIAARPDAVLSVDEVLG